MRLAAAGRAGQGSASTAVVDAVAVARRGTSGPAVLPDLSQFAAEFLAGLGPVCADVIAQLDNVALDFELVLLQP
jgi:hypothetical protein